METFKVAVFKNTLRKARKYNVFPRSVYVYDIYYSDNEIYIKFDCKLRFNYYNITNILNYKCYFILDVNPYYKYNSENNYSVFIDLRQKDIKLSINAINQDNFDFFKRYNIREFYNQNVYKIKKYRLCKMNTNIIQSIIKYNKYINLL